MHVTRHRILLLSFLFCSFLVGCVKESETFVPYLKDADVKQTINTAFLPAEEQKSFQYNGTTTVRLDVRLAIEIPAGVLRNAAGQIHSGQTFVVFKKSTSLLNNLALGFDGNFSRDKLGFDLGIQMYFLSANGQLVYQPNEIKLHYLFQSESEKKKEIFHYLPTENSWTYQYERNPEHGSNLMIDQVTIWDETRQSFTTFQTGATTLNHKGWYMIGTKIENNVALLESTVSLPEDFRKSNSLVVCYEIATGSYSISDSESNVFLFENLLGFDASKTIFAAISADRQGKFYLATMEAVAQSNNKLSLVPQKISVEELKEVFVRK